MLEISKQVPVDEFVPGLGAAHGAMVVGEAPGKVEWELKLPFQGPSGQLLNSVLESLGINRDDLYITNVVKSLPENVIYSKYSNAPRPEEIELWKPVLKEEIHKTIPMYILALGSVAYKTLTGSIYNVSLYRGMWYPLDEYWDWDLALVLPTFHPAAVLRDRRKMPIFERDIKLFIDTWRESYKERVGR